MEEGQTSENIAGCRHVMEDAFGAMITSPHYEYIHTTLPSMITEAYGDLVSPASQMQSIGTNTTKLR